MKSLSLMLAFTAACSASMVRAQQPASPPQQHQVGLIDMAHVFKNYEKFTAMTGALQKEIEQTDEQAKNLIDQIKRFQEQLASGNLQEGSPDYVKLENQMLKAQTDLETFKRMAQREFLRKEADIYKTIYLEVEDAVHRYADFYQYTLILRFNRQNVDEAEKPQDIINGMNRQVVFFRPKDDITDSILDYLNGEWRQRQSTGRPSSGAGQPAPRSATAPPTGGQTR